jgi:dTDP-4-dehydrorhamnose 3,5-epimerase
VVELESEKRQQLWIPEGFAHAFLMLEDNTLFAYKATNFYAPDFDRGIIWNDPDVGVAWPIKNPTLSEKDTVLPLFKDMQSEFTYTPS